MGFPAPAHKTTGCRIHEVLTIISWFQMAFHSLHLTIVTLLRWLLWCSTDLLHKADGDCLPCMAGIGIVQLTAWRGQWMGETTLSEICSHRHHYHHTEQRSFSLCQAVARTKWWVTMVLCFVAVSSLVRCQLLRVTKSGILLFYCLVVRNIYFERWLDILYHLLFR